MKIPKYITHPLLIGLLAAGLFYMLWLQSPSAEQVSQIQGATTANQTVPLETTKTILDRSKMYQITELLPEGFVVIEGLPQKVQINNERFRKLTIEQAEKLKDFFLGKFVRVDNTSKTTLLELPLELYEPNCFSNDPNVVALSKQCPLLLQP